MDAPQGDGKPLRVHLEAIYRQSGVMPEPLRNAPEPPRGGLHPWLFFCELSGYRRRVDNGYGIEIQRVTPGLLRDWSALRRIELEPWEIDAIIQIDLAYMVKVREAHK